MFALAVRSEAVDSTTPSGRAMLAMCGVFAEFEREMVRERVLAGVARAKAQGKRLGRPPVESEIERAIKSKRAKGLGILKIARELGIGTSVVQRVMARS
jgi:DNA invertase Pin-like site-specific DNA recombinase